MKSVTSPGQMSPARTMFTARPRTWARRMVLNMMNRLAYGRLIIRENDRTLAFGPGNGPEAVIQVLDPVFYTRVMVDGSIGAAESYVEGQWDTDDLTAVIRIIVRNQPVMDRMDNRLAILVKPLLRLAHQRRHNSKKGARRNILVHYDLGNDMYQTFLDPAMMYSAAIYPHDTCTLEEAAVGHRYLPAFMKTCESLLKPDGIMLIQAITIKDQLYRSYLKSVDFIQRHIFPGGCLPATHHLLRVLTDHTDMVARKLTDFGFDYAKTLNHWRKRFDASRDSLENLGYDRRFRRLWKFYRCYREGGFLERSISVIHLVATMPGNRTRI